MGWKYETRLNFGRLLYGCETIPDLIIALQEEAEWLRQAQEAGVKLLEWDYVDGAILVTDDPEAGERFGFASNDLEEASDESASAVDSDDPGKDDSDDDEDADQRADDERTWTSATVHPNIGTANLLEGEKSRRNWNETGETQGVMRTRLSVPTALAAQAT